MSLPPTLRGCLISRIRVILSSPLELEMETSRLGVLIPSNPPSLGTPLCGSPFLSVKLKLAYLWSVVIITLLTLLGQRLKARELPPKYMFSINPTKTDRSPYKRNLD